MLVCKYNNYNYVNSSNCIFNRFTCFKPKPLAIKYFKVNYDIFNYPPSVSCVISFRVPTLALSRADAGSGALCFNHGAPLALTTTWEPRTGSMHRADPDLGRPSRGHPSALGAIGCLKYNGVLVY